MLRLDTKSDFYHLSINIYSNLKSMRGTILKDSSYLTDMHLNAGTNIDLFLGKALKKSFRNSHILAPKQYIWDIFCMSSKGLRSKDHIYNKIKVDVR